MAQFARRIIDAKPRPTALISWDTYACSLLRLLQQHGRSIPDDMSIIGMDDILAAQTATPQLSSYRFPMEDMGHSATELVVERIKDRSRPVHQIIVSGKIVERATCAAAPGM
jgi:LacI family transcriptional regulator